MEGFPPAYPSEYNFTVFHSKKMAKDGTHQFSKSCDFDGPEVEEIEQLEITGKARTALCGKVRLLNRIMYERTYNIVFYVYRHARPILNVLTLHWIKVPQHAT